MHVYIFNSCVVYLCHCLANTLCMWGRRVQRRWVLRTRHCLQQTGCRLHGWLPASCFLLPLLLFLILQTVWSAPTLRVSHGCATRHCHHGNVSPTCATKFWPVIQTYSWDACEQKVWQHEAHTDLNRNNTFVLHDGSELNLTNLTAFEWRRGTTRTGRVDKRQSENFKTSLNLKSGRGVNRSHFIFYFIWRLL